jgi:hypothetical protein
MIVFCDLETLCSVAQCSLQPNIAATLRVIRHRAVVGVVSLFTGLQDDVNLAGRIVPNPDFLSALLRKIAAVVGASTVDIRGIGRTTKKSTKRCEGSKKRCRQSAVSTHETPPFE